MPLRPAAPPRSKPRGAAPPRTEPPSPHRTPDALARAAGFRCVAGVDEAGCGPWAGPVVAAAVILRAPHLPVRIDDSKRLTPAQRVRAFRVILDHAEVGFGIVCAQEIDRINILQAAHAAMQEAIRELRRTPDLILLDGRIPLAPPAPCWPIIRGDQRSYVIGCASIMAKVLRDRLMDFYHRLAPRYAFNRHKGYGTALHAERLRALGPSVFHRRSFEPVAEALLAEGSR